MDCIFCKIIKKEIKSEIISETERTVAFKDIHPSAPVHYLVAAKEHIKSVAHLEDSHAKIISEMIFSARDLAKKLGLKGYKVVFNVGKKGGQIIDHLHLHLLGGWNRKVDIDAMPHPNLDK